jgi:serine/threonine protein kinase
MVMEFLPGGSLDAYIADHKARNESIPEKVVLRIALGVARGMQALAAQNIIHRDLAARNILLDGVLEPKVSDFGFSRVVGDDKQGRTSAAIGPVRWMAPVRWLEFEISFFLYIFSKNKDGRFSCAKGYSPPSTFSSSAYLPNDLFANYLIWVFVS